MPLRKGKNSGCPPVQSLSGYYFGTFVIRDQKHGPPGLFSGVCYMNTNSENRGLSSEPTEFYCPGA